MQNFESTLFGRPNTVRTQKSLYNNWIKTSIPPGEAIAFTLLQLTSLVESWLEKDLSTRTVTMLIGLVRRYVIYHGGQELNVRALVNTVNRLTVKERVVGLTVANQNQLLKAAEIWDPPMYPVILLALHAGLRRGEVMGLARNDIDLSKGTLTVRRSYNGPTKSGKPRQIPLSNRLEICLRKCYNWLNENGDAKLNAPWDPNPRLAALCRVADIPEVSFHGLRHSFATRALEAKMSPKDVQELLGHTSLKTTLDYYWDSLPHKINMEFLND